MLGGLVVAIHGSVEGEERRLAEDVIQAHGATLRTGRYPRGIDWLVCSADLDGPTATSLNSCGNTLVTVAALLACLETGTPWSRIEIAPFLPSCLQGAAPSPDEPAMAETDSAPLRRHQQRAVDRNPEAGLQDGQLRSVVKGTVALDPFLDKEMQRHSHVHEVAGGTTYSAMLSQVDVRENKNKFYAMQLLVTRDAADAGRQPSRFSIWRRWGRNGRAGQTSIEPFESLGEAMAAFEGVFESKTGVPWALRADARSPRRGFYTLLSERYAGGIESSSLSEAGATIDELSHSRPSAAAKRVRHPTVASSSSSSSSSSLADADDNDDDGDTEGGVLDLIDMVADPAERQREVVESGYDAKALPLGRLTDDVLQRGKAVLSRIAQVLRGECRGDLLDLSADYLSLIPHDLGMSAAGGVLRSLADVERELSLLRSLHEAWMSQQLVEGAAYRAGLGASGRAVLSAIRASLNCDLRELTDGSSDMAVAEAVRQAVRLTHAPTHTRFRLRVERVFAINRHEEIEPWSSAHGGANTGHHLLGWHGTRLGNVLGILRAGLRAAPPEAPLTGAMFGRGVYFADSASKAAQYCFASPANPHGILLLAEAALGDHPHVLTESDDRGERDRVATLGRGKFTPDAQNHVCLHFQRDDDKDSAGAAPRRQRSKRARDSSDVAARIPQAAVIEPVVSPAEEWLGVIPRGSDSNHAWLAAGRLRRNSSVSESSLLYNEYVVFRPEHIRMRFVIQVRFDFDREMDEPEEDE